jgi:hypothetical protein
VKSYLRNIINLSWDKILLTSVIFTLRTGKYQEGRDKFPLQDPSQCCAAFRALYRLTADTGSRTRVSPLGTPWLNRSRSGGPQNRKSNFPLLSQICQRPCRLFGLRSSLLTSAIRTCSACVLRHFT